MTQDTIVKFLLRIPFVCIKLDYIDANLHSRQIVIYDYPSYKYFMEKMKNMTYLNIPDTLSKRIILRFRKETTNERVHRYREQNSL